MSNRSCDPDDARARLHQFIEDWAEGRGTVPAWASLIASEAGVKTETVADLNADPSDTWLRNWLATELRTQVDYASRAQACGYDHVLTRYTGEGQRFRRRLTRGR